MSERDAVLAAVRRNLAGVEPPEPGVAPEVRIPGTATPTERLARFRAQLASVGGRVEVARDARVAAALLRDIVAEKGARTVAVSDAALARELAAGLDGVDGVAVACDAERAFLLEADLGLSCAQWGIAETGTLVLESERERNRLVSLVPPVHVAVLQAGAILATLGDALAAVRRPEHGAPSRAVTFITGPSRTGDIELTLVVGVHGPKELVVIVIDPEESER